MPASTYARKALIARICDRAEVICNHAWTISFNEVRTCIVAACARV